MKDMPRNIEKILMVMAVLSIPITYMITAILLYNMPRYTIDVASINNDGGLTYITEDKKDSIESLSSSEPIYTVDVIDKDTAMICYDGNGKETCRVYRDGRMSIATTTAPININK